MKTLILAMALAAPICWAADKPEPVFERGVITAFSNEGRPMDHWILIQTDCCNYTVQNWRLFGRVTGGGSNELRIVDDHIFIRVRDKVAKARIVKAEQREDAARK